MVDANKIRPDVHERVLRIRAREEAAYIAHVEFIRQLVLCPLPEEEDWVVHAQARRDEAREP